MSKADQELQLELVAQSRLIKQPNQGYPYYNFIPFTGLYPSIEATKGRATKTPFENYGFIISRKLIKFEL